MPVRNEARHVDAALRALRAQTYRDLEIIVCDNASTDDTAAICRRHADEDPRVRFEPVPSEISVTDNFRRSVDLARGEYFLWASGHDLWAPGLVDSCVRALQATPDACLAYGTAHWIGPDGEPLPRVSGWYDTRGMDPVARFFAVLWSNMHPVLGVMRTRTLRECGPLAAMVGADLVLLSKMALRGHFVHVRDADWFRRESRFEARYADRVKRYVSGDTRVARSPLARRFPLLALPLALAGVALRAPLPWPDRIGMLASLPPLLVLRYVAGRRSHGR